MKCFNFFIGLFAIAAIISCGSGNDNSSKKELNGTTDSDQDSQISSTDDDQDKEPDDDSKQDTDPQNPEKDDSDKIDEKNDSETIPEDLCEDVTCNDHGECVLEKGLPICDCEEGYENDFNNPTGCVIKRDSSLIISEIVQNEISAKKAGSYIEIYNATDAAIDLSGYRIATNGASESLDQEGVLSKKTINPGEAVAISRNILQLMEPTDYFANVFGFSSVGHSILITHLTENRAIILLNPDDEVIDIYGKICDNVCDFSWDYQNKIVRRKFGVKSGSKTWNKDEWDAIDYEDVVKEANPEKHFVSDPCSSKTCDNEWNSCNTLTGECDILKEGMCSKSEDCKAETPKCNTETHTCEAIDVADSENLIRNGSFEEWEGNYPAHWNGNKTYMGSAEALLFTDSPYDGSNAIQIVNATNNVRRFTTAEIPALEAGTYNLSYYVKGNGKFTVGYYSQSGSVNGGSSDFTAIDSRGWTKKSFTFTLDSPTTNVQFSIWTRETNLIEYHDSNKHLVFDKFSCVKM